MQSYWLRGKAYHQSATEHHHRNIQYWCLLLTVRYHFVFLYNYRLPLTSDALFRGNVCVNVQVVCVNPNQSNPNFKSVAGTGWTGSQIMLIMTPVLQFMPEKTFTRHGATPTAMPQTQNGFVKKRKTTGVNVLTSVGNGGLFFLSTSHCCLHSKIFTVSLLYLHKICPNMQLESNRWLWFLSTFVVFFILFGVRWRNTCASEPAQMWNSCLILDGPRNPHTQF